ncbi:helix-turn-helix domain-containing protein [Lacihabitans sp. LS3-19]|uniref:helix-turn-helix domain-containing protein n=1 Tax=Lacihabitans sp. LS3-19 TaxID=2487335 RepID=UPI0020CF3950|nr:helix-turn-helix domain-containing protein [Lacihabitans sp. LS3-19]
MFSPENALYKKLEILIDSNLENEHLSSDFICQELGVSRTKLHRVLKQNTQFSFSLFIRKKRIERAKVMLMNTEMRISEIADAVGINTHQNFTKYFTEEYGTNPTEFRKNIVLPAATETLQKSIAVLPFVNMSNDTEQEYFSDGITEEIINVLAQISSLKVAGRTSAFSFKNKNYDLRQIGSLLNVNYLLEGSVRRSGSILRITAQLIEVQSGFHLWSKKYDCELRDIFEIQDEISLAILEEIKVELLGEKEIVLQKRDTINPEAYQLYLHGLFYVNKFSNTETFKMAISYFEKALLLEPNYLECHAHLASCYIYLWFFSQVAPVDSVEKARMALTKASSIDAENANLLIQKGHLKTWYEWDLLSAKELFERVIIDIPTSVDALMQYALCLTLLEQHDKAILNLKKAIEKDPFSGILQMTLSWCYWHQGDFENAENIADKLLAMKPHFWGGQHLKALCLLERFSLDEAIGFAQKAVELYPSSMNYALLAHICNFLGDAKKAKEIEGIIVTNIDKFPVSKFDLGHLNVALGNLDKGQQYFQEALDTHESRILFIHKAYRKAKIFKLHPQFQHFFEAIDKVTKPSVF